MATKLKAFTLIELLVVISIIALLLSILMPSLNKVRQKAQTVICMTNSRAIGTAIFVYVPENGGFFPLSGQNKGTLYSNAYPLAPYWDVCLLPYLGAQNVNLSDFTGTNWSPSKTKLAKYKKECGLYSCPAANGRFRQNLSDIQANGYFPRSYMINDNLAGGPTRNAVKGGMPTTAALSWRKGDSSRLTNIKSTGNTIAVLCQGLSSNWQVVNSLSGFSNYSWFATFPSHEVKTVNIANWAYPWGQPATEGSSTFLFSDGHSANLKYRFADDKFFRTQDYQGSNPPNYGISGVKWHPSGQW